LPPQLLVISLRRAQRSAPQLSFSCADLQVRVVMASEFWCSSCRRHRPVSLFGAKVDKFRSYCRDCLTRRKQAMQAIHKTPATPGSSPK
jgi:hypothetical protein